MSTTSKLIVSGILAILLVALGTTSIIQANGFKPTEEQIQKCKEIKASYGLTALHGGFGGEKEAPAEIKAEWNALKCGLIEEVH